MKIPNLFQLSPNTLALAANVVLPILMVLAICVAHYSSRRPPSRNEQPARQEITGLSPAKIVALFLRASLIVLLLPLGVLALLLTLASIALFVTIIAGSIFIAAVMLALLVLIPFSIFFFGYQLIQRLLPA